MPTSETSPVGQLGAAVVERETRSIERQVVEDAMKQYETAKASGSKMDACVHAGIVSAALIQAKDTPGLERWKPMERKDCARAGVPQQ